MALANLPVWSILPDWREGVLERLEWLTSILASRTGAEQRMALRLAPRRSFEVRMTLIDRERTLFDLSVSQVGSGEWWVPIWHDGTRLATALPAGATTIPVDTADRSFQAPGAALLRGKTAFDYEVVEVAVVGGTALTLAAGTASAWPAGTRLYALREARLAEMPKPTRRGDNAAVAQCQFMQTVPEDYPAVAPPTTYLGYPVLETHPDETKDLTGEYSRMLAEIDNSSGRPKIVDRAGMSFTLQQFTWFMHGVQSHADIRGLLYALQGRRTPLWLPTQFADLVLATAALGTSNAVDVTLCGFTAFGGPKPGREHIRIELRDGTAIHRRVLTAALTSDGKEHLVLDAALGQTIAPDRVRRISFLALNRLDQDAVEIAHQTDSRGVSTVVASFRSTPETRVAANWSPPALAMSVQTPWSCGEGMNCEANGLWAAAYFTPAAVSFLALPDNRVVSYRFAVTQEGWTPEIIAAVQAVTPFDPFGGTHGSYGPDISQRSRDAVFGAVDAGTSHGAVMCGVKILGVAEIHTSFFRNSAGVDFAKHILMLCYTDDPAFDPKQHVIQIRRPSDSAILQESGALTFSRYAVEGGGYLHMVESFNGGGVFYFVLGYDIQIDPYAGDWLLPAEPCTVALTP